MRTKVKTAATEQPELIVEKSAVALAEKNTQPVARIATGPDALFAIIERASRDNSIDLDRMQKLIDMHKELKTDNARAEYDSAMALAQAEMKTIKTNKSNSHTSSKYANYEALDKAIRPIYTAQGFALSFNTGDSPRAEEVRVLCTVSHRAGHRQEYKIDVPSDGKGAKGESVMTKTHAMGAAAQYGQRYLFKLIFNLSVGDDDDGNSAASIAERAETWANQAIEYFNLSKPDAATLAKYRTEKKKGIDWLKNNSPTQYERFQTAYSNAAEAAGIKKEEPKRGGNNQSSSATSPHSESAKDGQPVNSPPAGAGGDSKSEAASTPGLTDVEDLSETEFEMFDTARKFFDFSDHWLQEPKRTPAEAKKWEEFYREKIKEMANHKFERIREAVADTIGLYSAVLAKETPA